LQTKGETAFNIYYSPAYATAGYSFDTTRKSAWIADSLRDKPIRGVAVVEPKPLTRKDLLAVHSTEYVDAVACGRPRWLAESNGFTWDDGLWTAVCASSGGAVAAALDASGSGGNAGSLSSGLHHAGAGMGGGFCTFNGLALAASAARDRGARRILIVDVDAHCGGGTWGIVRDWGGVVQVDVSVSGVDSYKVDPGAASTLAIVRSADAYVSTIEHRLGALASTRFDLLLYNAGMDPHQASAIGGMRGVTFEMLARRECLVFNWARRRGIPVAFVLAGGYSGGELSQADLVGLHRLTIAAAVEAGAGHRCEIEHVMESAYVGPKRGTEGFYFDANGRKGDAGLYCDLD
jgi:acetoin utilization deacetylase AcuC-like enzyme